MGYERLPGGRREIWHVLLRQDPRRDKTMSDLSNPREAASWIAAWRAEPGGKRRIRAAATEQRANLTTMQREGRSPSWCNLREYEKAVQILEAEAKG